MPLPLKPRQPVPALTLATVDGPAWTLADRQPAKFTMVVFYRGLHCPVCRKYLTELERLAGEFESRGVDVFVASSDDEARARETKTGWGLAHLAIGYGLSIDKAREWGLFVSTSRGRTSAGIEEPALFSEPGLFLVRPDGTLYWANVSTMPFARPHFDEILLAIDFAVKNDYPARGEA